VTPIGERCYDLNYIFDKKFGEQKLAFLAQTTASFCKKK
jgi:hypothetical protein